MLKKIIRNKLVKAISLLILSQFFLSSTALAADSGKMKVNDINIYYEIHGTGKPVILIAGFTCDHTFWSGILKQLAANHKVLIFDNRGIGQTDSPKTPYSIEMMADDVMGLSKKLGLENPIIIGQSMGTAITQNIAKRYADQIQKIVLINTFDQLTKAPEMAFELTGELQSRNLPLRYRVQSIAPWVFSSAFLSQPNQLENLIKLAEQNPYPQSLVGYEGQLDALKKFNSQAWLNQIKTPTLIIAGEDDIIAPLAGAKEVQEKIGHNTPLEIIPGGHASPVEQPQKVADFILKFIDKK
ncbi:Putative non-heme bromoperoxidase BpoC [Legionella massiliensis]|uniref:Putative non-heme bromoperoxidase BpoC n=1 Tax=Legionella massiliensis TaxID=1034943 RepID=A0A078KZE2_9GAMM|nr:alpha/beta hydrolase [Legionella massiliensis]CDZ78387.1 Putative non-heme bromoperoxidase BpoC [Legionella massiliensis]CEE14125.1 Putative non-heme bromoperoxidase BpoC [Legionella massiliensis]